jgi:hypothetical protein
MTTQEIPAGIAHQECVICEDSTDFPETTHLKEHSICNDCIKEYLRIKIMEEALVDIPCLLLGCYDILEYNDVQTYVTVEEFETYYMSEKSI